MKLKRSAKRTIFLKGLVSAGSAQIVSIVLGVISVPIGLSYFEPLKYGIWLVIGSIVAYLGLSPLGTGTAASTLIAKHSDREAQGVIFWRTLWLLCRIAIFLIGLAGLAAIFAESWVGLLGDIPNTLKHEAIAAVLVTVIFYLLRLPTIAFTSAFIGLQEVHWERFYVVLLPVVFSFGALLITLYLSGDLVVLACLTGGGQLLAGLLAGFHFFLRHRKMMQRAVRLNSDAAVTKDLLGSGSRFFFIGIAAMVVWNTDNLVISYFLGPGSVTAYAITFKLFSTAFSIFVLANSVLMPMFGNAVGKSEWTWLSQTYENALSIMIVFGGLVWVGGLVFAKPVILLWTGLSGYGGELVVFAMGGYGYVLSAVNLHANLLSGMNATRSMLWIGIAEAIVNFTLSVILIRWWGIGGVALGTFLSALFTVYWLLPKDIARQTESKVKVCWSPIIRHFGLAVLPGIGAAYFINNVMQGWEVWGAGAGLCAAYLAVSWLLLSRQAQAMLTGIVSVNSRSSNEGVK